MVEGNGIATAMVMEMAIGTAVDRGRIRSLCAAQGTQKTIVRMAMQ